MHGYTLTSCVGNVKLRHCLRHVTQLGVSDVDAELLIRFYSHLIRNGLETSTWLCRLCMAAVGCDKSSCVVTDGQTDIQTLAC